MTFYGPGLFKYPRISCTYSGCPCRTLSFNSVRDLNRHLADSHEARQYEGTQFPITQDPQEIDIKRAIRLGSIAEVERWLEQFSKLDMNSPLSKCHKDALLAAVKKGDETILKLLQDSLPNMTATEISRLCSTAFKMGQDTIGCILLSHPRANKLRMFFKKPRISCRYCSSARKD